METAATLRPGSAPEDVIDPATWTEEVRSARLNVRWRATTHRGFCRLQRTTADGVVVNLEAIGRRRQDLLVTAHAFDGISHGVGLRDRMARSA